jgi:hypothetical protein
MQESYGEGPASRPDPESCGSGRKASAEALTWGVFGPRVNLLIPHPRVLHPHPNDRFYAKHPK